MVDETVREALGILCDAERQAISVAYFGGHSYVEAARLLGVPEEAVKSRIRSGLGRLRTAVVDGGVDLLMANSSSSASQP